MRAEVGGLAFGLRTPRSPVLGIELAEAVDAVGAAVTRFAIGQEVYGFARGSIAEYAVSREDRLALKPANLSFEQIAIVPVSASTALQALAKYGRTQRGQTMLVTGAA